MTSFTAHVVLCKPSLPLPLPINQYHSQRSTQLGQLSDIRHWCSASSSPPHQHAQLSVNRHWCSPSSSLPISTASSGGLVCQLFFYWSKKGVDCSTIRGWVGCSIYKILFRFIQAIPVYYDHHFPLSCNIFYTNMCSWTMEGHFLNSC